MKRRLIEVIKGETGQVLPAVLVLMLIGGLLIAPSLSYASTSLNAGQIFEKKVNGLYAADAGVEYALWYLKKFSSLPEELPEIVVNQMQVAIDTEDTGEEYTLYKGGFVSTGDKYYSLAVYGELDEETYQYTITVAWQPASESQTISLGEVGVRLPLGYEYEPDSAFGFGDNLSTGEPEDTLDGAGAHMLNWTFGTPSPYVTNPEKPNPVPERTQMFYVTGEGALEGDYTWVGTHGHVPIGTVGEIVGKLYRIKATAKQDNKTTATVEADALVKVTEGETETEIRVILWQVNPPEE